MTAVYFVVPDGIEDPARPSGGNAYDLHVSRGLPIAQAEGEVLLAIDQPIEAEESSGPTYPSANRRDTGTWLRIVAMGSGIGLRSVGLEPR